MKSLGREKVLHVDKVIPAGTSVKAMIVSSVDAPCGVLSQSDPRPVKLRILDDARLPKSVRVKLKGGIVIASAFGNISSERVSMRLEKLTQTKRNGDFVETGVTGFVSGEDGKYGVRGVVVDRSGKLVASAAFSGMIGGINRFLQTNLNTHDIRDATEGLPNTLRYDVLKESGLAGGTNALEKLSEYYIKRAEQIQPIIQVAAGRFVDITFTNGCDMGDLHNKDKVEKIRESNG